MTAKIFISYRRDDSKYQALMIREAFCQVIPRANVQQIIRDWVNQCEVLLALIGPRWAGDPKTKRRRLDDPSDFVRVEIREALVRGISVVPVLLDGTPMPKIALLPDDLKELAHRQAAIAEYRTFNTDVAQLIRKLGLAAPDPQEDTKELLPKSGKRSGAQAERYRQGALLRRETPRERHADLGPRDPVKILAAGDRARMPELVPMRYARMLTTPFAFMRGAAAVMAQDLKNEPRAGIAVQACGDCQLMNFGAFTTPEGMIHFDINDFDETLPGVDFTVDLKRLASSVAVAALGSGFSTKRARAAAATTVAAYRLRMGALAKLSPLEIWHSKIDLVQEMSRFEDLKLRKKFKAVVKKAAKKIAEHDDNVPQMMGGARIADKAPLIYHPGPTVDTGQRFDANEVFASYKKSLPSDSLRVFEQYTLRDTAFKVTGVASVGTFCTINLFTSRDGAPLFLQLKEARTSVLERCFHRIFVPCRSLRISRLRADRLRRDRRLRSKPGGYSETAAGACCRGKHQARRMASLRRAQQCAAPFRQGRQADQSSLKRVFTHGLNCRTHCQAGLAFSVHPGPSRRARRSLRRTGDPLRVAAGWRAAIALDILFGQRLHDLQSLVALRWPGELRADRGEPGLSPNAGQHLYLHVRIAISRARPRQVRCAVAVAAVPGAQDRQGADHIAVGGADRARHRRLAMDVRFALQRDQLDDDRARRHRPF
jgi:Uncharacterized protein conserved in bacteria (DUF2252)